ncbi:2-oxo-4-hydroxy-4-carboxy-5-ureidoimidazoline decarboxylase [Albimonas sp. CAU 1670]|uniref:2-oxo-4-hydroxy-4-carboxy-5-ureidoimidazoline decarboxylase n=1 Tax=Albimonas sp. CAU 1670 TaxID=3032599 RepID=UPI0023DA31B9|nr:2-oxo-4-hydroxy-4-carboxy-5-ureidoimidazoline decarboxylase [Albimonas sp. CAU 1670]MDF2232659.1 2-oxo-4-hydroxy-4-carboxy-5-ureidoimidazoline decarboxylase [Albimonas sp. CAU 1670]
MFVFAQPPAEMPRDAFVATFGGVYEHSPWVAERAWDQGLGEETATAGGLSGALHAQVTAASHAERLALLRAHPDLAGKLALAGGLTAESSAEQAGAGLDQCTPEELAEFQDLNARYQARFGFPYILAVKGRRREQILENFRARVDEEPEAEFEEAIEQVRRIALLRLEAMAGD